MIGFVRGRVAERGIGYAVIDVGGVGYDVSLSLFGMGTLPNVGEEATVYTHTHVREDALQLYGFVDTVEREAFRILIAVSGIGPRMAMQILGGISVSELATAVLIEDLARLKSLPGVGKKTAERLLIELRDKVGRLGVTLEGTAEPGSRTGDPILEDLRSALTNLGYRAGKVDKALKKLQEKGEWGDFQEALRGALALVR